MTMARPISRSPAGRPCQREILGHRAAGAPGREEQDKCCGRHRRDCRHRDRRSARCDNVEFKFGRIQARAAYFKTASLASVWAITPDQDRHQPEYGGGPEAQGLHGFSATSASGSGEGIGHDARVFVFGCRIFSMKSPDPVKRRTGLSYMQGTVSMRTAPPVL